MGRSGFLQSGCESDGRGAPEWVRKRKWAAGNRNERNSEIWRGILQLPGPLTCRDKQNQSAQSPPHSAPPRKQPQTPLKISIGNPEVLASCLASCRTLSSLPAISPGLRWQSPVKIQQVREREERKKERKLDDFCSINIY